jgi:hypothetical protein
MKKYIFLTVITAGIMLSGCSTNLSSQLASQPEKWRYQPRSGVAAHLPDWHPLAKVYKADIMGAIDARGRLMERRGLGLTEAYGREVAKNIYDIVRLTNPAAIGYEQRKAADTLRIDPGIRYECSLVRVTTAMVDKNITTSFLKAYSDIPLAVTGYLSSAAAAVSQEAGGKARPQDVPVDSCPEKDSLADELRLVSALSICSAERVKTALTDTRSIDDKIAAAPGVIEFHAVKLARLTPSGLAHILLSNVFSISDPCVARDWSGDPEAFVTAAIDAANAIVFHPTWMGVLRDKETGVFFRRIHDVAKAVDPATNKPWLNIEQRRRLSSGLLTALAGKDFNLMKDRKKESWPSIENLEWVITIGNLFNPKNITQPTPIALLYAEYLAMFDTVRTKLKDNLLVMAAAIASDEKLPAEIANEYPIAASEVYLSLTNGQQQSVRFDSLFR